MAFYFFCTEVTNCLNYIVLGSDYTHKLWQPSVVKLRPPGVSLCPFSIWWLFHYTHIFSNNKYCVLLISYNNKVIHRSLITPGYFRYPFMGKNDLQIGDIWTEVSFRGQGIATSAIALIFNHFKSEKLKFWYVVNENNLASIKLAERSGFTFCGKGERCSRLGIPLLGRYLLSKN